MRFLRLLLVSAATTLGMVSAALPASAAGAPGSFDSYSYTNTAGTRTYRVYVPPAYDGHSLPLLVELHGCNPDSAETEARWSGFNRLAATEKFLVAYPQQDLNANGSGCWNWFNPGDWTRNSGEPSLIAGITAAVAARWHTDPRRTYVGGISAGGAMADVMAVAYPDVYAAALIYAGCEYMGTATCLGSVSVLPGSVSGELAFQQMGPRARVVPIMVVQGDTDPVVPFPNSTLILQQFLSSDALATGGAVNPLPPTPTSSTPGAKPGGQAYTIDDYADAHGCLLAERWLVHGMMHQWSNASSDGSLTDMIFTDPAGPDVTLPTWRFLAAHPMPPAGNGCFQATAAIGSAPPPASPPRTLPATATAGDPVALAAPLLFVALAIVRRRRRPALSA